MLAVLQRLFAHMAWADALAIESLRRTTTAPETLAVYAHVLGAEHVWLSRLRQARPDHVVWPTLDLDECAALAADNERGYRSYLESLDDGVLADDVPYTNSAGQAFRSRVDDILLHVAMHGSYHRGQIASQVRRAGGTPASTDYIGFVRGVPAARTPR
jgi:uncharacterized damage-inducible protein DinB